MVWVWGWDEGLGKVGDECVRVGMWLGGNEEGGMCEEGVELGEVEEEVGRGLGGRVKILEEGVWEGGGRWGRGEFVVGEDGGVDVVDGGGVVGDDLWERGGEDEGIGDGGGGYDGM